VHLSKVDLNLFVMFDTIYAEGGITCAGRRLNLSQPAISHAFGRLRAMFDDPLFTRHGHAMTPTSLARRMIEPVRQALRGLEVTLSKVDRFDAANAVKHFTVGIPNVVGSVVVPGLMRTIARTALRVDISIVKAERRELELELSTGTGCGDRRAVAAAGGDKAPAYRR
jgi:DNA-binding transcriptional LysR family regulator